MGDWQNWGNAQVVAGTGTGGSSALQVGPGAGGAALQVPGVVGGTTYRLTAQVRVTDPANGPATLGVDFYNASGARIIGTRALPNVTNTSFAPFSYDVQAPAGTAYALVWVWKDGSTGFAYVDDVAFGAATAPPASAAAAPAAGQPDFQRWLRSRHDRLGRLGQHPRRQRQRQLRCLALSVGTAAGGAGHNVDGIVPGTSYRLTVSAKVSDASDKVFVGVNFVDSAGSLVGSTQQSTSSTSYTPISADIVAPPGAVRAVVYVWKNAGSGLAYVDDYVFGVALGLDADVDQVSPNLVVNGNFEGFTGWVNWGNTTIVGPDIRATRAQVGTGAGGVGQSVGGIVAGQIYRLTAQVNVSTAGETGYLGLKFLDAAGNSVQDQVVPFSSTADPAHKCNSSRLRTRPARWCTCGRTRAPVSHWSTACRWCRWASLLPRRPWSSCPHRRRNGSTPTRSSPTGARAWPGSSNGNYVVAWVATRRRSGLGVHRVPGVLPAAGHEPGAPAVRMCACRTRRRPMSRPECSGARRRVRRRVEVATMVPVTAGRLVGPVFGALPGLRRRG